MKPLPEDVVLRLFEVAVDVDDVPISVWYPVVELPFVLLITLQVCKRYYDISKARSIWVENFKNAALSRAYGPASLHSTHFLRLYLKRFSRLTSTLANAAQPEIGDGVPGEPLVPFKTHFHHIIKETLQDFEEKRNTLQGRLFFFLGSDWRLSCFDLDDSFKEVWVSSVPLTAPHFGNQQEFLLRCSEIFETATPGVGKFTLMVVFLGEVALSFHDFEIRFHPRNDIGVEEIQVDLVSVQFRDTGTPPNPRQDQRMMHGHFNLLFPWFLQQCKTEARVYHIPSWTQFILEPPEPGILLEDFRASQNFAGNDYVVSQIRRETPSDNGDGPIRDTILAFYALPDVSNLTGSSIALIPQSISCIHRVTIAQRWIGKVSHPGTSFSQTMHLLCIASEHACIRSFTIPPKLDVPQAAGNESTFETRVQEYKLPVFVMGFDAYIPSMFGTRMLSHINLGLTDNTGMPLTSFRQTCLLDDRSGSYSFGDQTLLQTTESVTGFHLLGELDDIRGRVVIPSITVADGGISLKVDCVQYV